MNILRDIEKIIVPHPKSFMGVELGFKCSTDTKYLTVLQLSSACGVMLHLYNAL